VCGPLAAAPDAVVDAQFSLPFSIATALVRGAACGVRTCLFASRRPP
jgi:2-methylcitrate dehydratase PrpD